MRICSKNHVQRQFAQILGASVPLASYRSCLFRIIAHPCQVLGTSRHPKGAPCTNQQGKELKSKGTHETNNYHSCMRNDCAPGVCTDKNQQNQTDGYDTTSSDDRNCDDICCRRRTDVSA